LPLLHLPAARRNAACQDAFMELADGKLCH
jgi:hypothetical protein